MQKPPKRVTRKGSSSTAAATSPTMPTTNTKQNNKRTQQQQQHDQTTLFSQSNFDIDHCVLSHFCSPPPIEDSCVNTQEKGKRAVICKQQHKNIVTMRQVSRTWRRVVDSHFFVFNHVSVRWGSVQGPHLKQLVQTHGEGIRALDVGHGFRVKGDELRQIAQSCPHITSIDIDMCKELDDSILKTLSELHTLKVIVLEHCKSITNQGIDLLAQNCPGMRSLNIRDCELSDSSLRSLATYCKGLRSLNAVMCDFSDDGVLALATECQQLDTISLGGCLQVTDTAVVAIAKHCKLLRKIYLWGCLKITDVAIQALALNCAQLEGLDVEECLEITDEAMLTVSERCLGLTSLHMASCSGITDKGVKAIARRCTKLNAFELEHCMTLTDDALIAITQSCTGLTNINARGCLQFSNDSIATLAEFCPMLTDLQVAECDDVSEDALCKVIEKCPRLTSLNIGQCTSVLADDVALTISLFGKELVGIYLWETNISDIGIARIANSCTTRLLHIDLQECNFVTSVGVLALCVCTNLSCINLALCSRVTAEAITRLVSSCPRLVDIDLEGLLVTDSTIQNIVTSCPLLTTLSVRGCPMLTSRTLKALLPLEALGTLIIGCPCILETALNEFKLARPTLHVNTIDF